MSTESVQKRGLLGFGFCFIGALGTLATIVLFPPPSFSELSVSRHTVTAAPFIKSHRGGNTATLPVGLANMSFACDWPCHHLPVQVAALQEGEKITIWHDGPEIWQIGSAGRMIYTYNDAINADNSNRWGYRKIFFGLFLFGLVLAWITRARARHS
jgi:hypothetical protein